MYIKGCFARGVGIEMKKEKNMLMCKLKTTGSRNYCRDAFVIYHDLDILLMSCGVAICTIKKDGSLIMNCKDGELSAADKRHLKIFCERFKHRIS